MNLAPADWVSIITWIGGIAIAFFSFLFLMIGRAIFFVRSEAATNLDKEKEALWKGVEEAKAAARNAETANASAGARSAMMIESVEKSLNDYKVYMAERLSRDISAALQPVTSQLMSLQKEVSEGIGSLSGQVGLLIGMVRKD